MPLTPSFFSSSLDDDESDGNGNDSRDEVNRDLAAEQSALRKRAAAAAVYDFDGTYENFQKPANKKQDSGKKESRYIAGLLKQAKRRANERDIIYERKIAREQAEEEKEADFAGKERFMTSAYKKKLAERERWAKEEEEAKEREDREDVTKRTDGGAIASFYTNLNRHVPVGKPTDEPAKETKGGHSSEATKEPTEKRLTVEKASGPSFLDGFEPASGGYESQQTYASKERTVNDQERKKEVAREEKLDSRSIRQIREEKVAQARIQYFQRHGIDESSKQ